MPYKVFISYATKDLATVNQFAQILTYASNNSVEVYIAEYSATPGVVLANHILNAIQTCDLFLLFWSSHSKASEWVPQEIRVAKQAQRLILPILLEHELELPGFIKDLKYLAAYEDLARAMGWVRGHVYERARQKQQTEGLTWLALGAGLLWLFTRDNE